MACVSLSLILVATHNTMTYASRLARQGPEYAVYSAVIREAVLKQGWAGNPRGQRTAIGRVVISARTRYYLGSPISDWVKTRAPALEAETALDFASRSAPLVFERQFENIGEYALLTDSALQSMRIDRDWTGFYSQFPDAPGMVSFSNVGFNRAGTQAAVFMMHTRANLRGEMSFYLLRKTTAGWEIVNRVSVGAS